MPIAALQRYIDGLNNREAIVVDLNGEVPEVCRPRRSESGDNGYGCLMIQALIGTTLLKYDKGVLTASEVLEDVRGDPTCEQCPQRSSHA